MKKILVLFMILISLELSGLCAGIFPGLPSYLQTAQDKIDENWAPPSVGVPYHISILYTIKEDGSAVFEKILESSKLEIADSAAILAVQKSSPFIPPKEAGLPNTIKTEFVFDYTVPNKPLVQTVQKKKETKTKKEGAEINVEDKYLIKNLDSKTNDFTILQTGEKRLYTTKKAEDAETKNYVKRMEKIIKSNWAPEGKADTVTVKFKVDEGGNISEIRIKKSSDNKKEDFAAVEAVKKSSPLNPPPKGKLDVEFTFDYGAAKKG